MITVEEVTGGKDRVRFTELPAALHGRDPRFAPPLAAWERYRLDVHRNPFFDAGDAAYLLARRMGRPVGRIVAHVAARGAPGRFGFWSVPDDPAVANALLDGARTWLTDQGCSSMEGPWSFTEAEEVGVLAEGFDAAGLTGRSWSPPHEAALLEAAGLAQMDDRPTWRLSTEGTSGPERPTADDVPGHAGIHADRRLVLEGIAAVPDLAAAMRGARLSEAWSLAKRSRARDWDTCTVVRCTDDPAIAVPDLLAAAARVGYATVIAPWSPDPDASPETVHRTYRLTW